MGRGASFLAGMTFSLAILAVSLNMVGYAIGFGLLGALLLVLSFVWED